VYFVSKHFVKKQPKRLRTKLKTTVKSVKRFSLNTKQHGSYRLAWLSRELSRYLANLWYDLKSAPIKRWLVAPSHSKKRLQASSQNPKLTVNNRLRAYKLVSILSLTIALLITFANSSYAFYYYILRDLPSPEKLTATAVPLTTKIYDRNGILLYKIYGRQNRSWLRLSQIPKSVIDATISIEDKDFYYHKGLSFTGITRAAIAYAKGEPLQGGSTITQQLVKNVFLSPERTWIRKIKEIILTLETENRYSKDEILTMYLNVVGYGGQAYGIEEASEQYFGLAASELNLAQAALLAGLTASPTTYSPYGAHPELARTREEVTLQRMFEEGKISYQQMEEALAYDINYQTPKAYIKAPHFVMWLKEQLVQKYGEEMVDSGGLEVHTSLDYNLQRQAEVEIERQLALLKFENVTNGAAMVTNTKTGEILAMVGSRDYFDTNHDGNVNVCLMPRQPGSSIKVVTYTTALEDGFNAGTIINDSAVSYPQIGSIPYTPVNYDGQYHGNVTLRTALASSYNIPAVKTLATLGIPKVVAKGVTLGIKSWQNADQSRFGLSLTLGGVEVKMTEMMEVYSTIGNGGKKVNLQPVLEIRDGSGRILEKASAEEDSPQVVKPAVAYIISKILSDNTARTPAFGPNSVLYIPGYDVAVKTGTTNNLKDNWTFGFTPNYTVGVWVGNNDNSSMSAVASGITGASPIWQGIMKSLVESKTNAIFTAPSDLVAVNICPQTGTLSCEACPGYSEYFARGTEPQTHCNNQAIQKLLDEKKKKAEEDQQTAH